MSIAFLVPEILRGLYIYCDIIMGKRTLRLWRDCTRVNLCLVMSFQVYNRHIDDISLDIHRNDR